MNKLRNNKGITLIALIVSIIVLIILSGVAVNTFLGDQGIVTKARNAAEAQRIAAITERMKIIGISRSAEDLKWEWTLDEYIDNLQGQEGINITGIEKEDGNNKAYLTIDGKYEYLVEIKRRKCKGKL